MTTDVHIVTSLNNVRNLCSYNRLCIREYMDAHECSARLELFTAGTRWFLFHVIKASEAVISFCHGSLVLICVHTSPVYTRTQRTFVLFPHENRKAHAIYDSRSLLIILKDAVRDICYGRAAYVESRTTLGPPL